MKMISIAEDFTTTPAGRYRQDGDFSGEAFRDDILVPALKASDIVKVVLDGTRGYGSSFLEETFGGLVRKGHFTKDELTSKLEIIAETSAFQHYKKLVEKYINDARPQ
ncbi:STAS-like domain-containing protein [Terasakiella sp.]|uniref:STAS-like domain-containing protein n=1 Tax=Terasakiella sp. TaxID=2034861 RepID=UPI003AA9680F